MKPHVITALLLAATAITHVTSRTPTPHEKQVAAFWAECTDDVDGGVLATDYCLEIGESLGVVYADRSEP